MRDPYRRTRSTGQRFSARMGVGMPLAVLKRRFAREHRRSRVMTLSSSLRLAMVLSVLGGCGFALQRTGVSRSYQAHYGCLASKVRRTPNGYHVEGCGRSAEYVCLGTPAHPLGRAGHGSELGAALVEGALFGTGQRCVLASSERDLTTPVVASSAPAGVWRVQARDGHALLKTRVLFAGGHLRALAAPRDHREHVLLLVRGVARMKDVPCESQLFRDGVPVPIVQQAREGAYEAQLVVPVTALSAAQDAVRFSGSVCGIEFELDPSSRATLGLFAARFREEQARSAEHEQGERQAAVTAPEVARASAASPP
jgi:hypothetical protein